MPPLPSPLQDHACAFIDGGDRIIVAGDSPATADTLILDRNANQWTAGPALPQARGSARLVNVGRKLVLLGGFDAGSGFPAEMYELSSDGSSWAEMSVKLDRGRTDFVAVAVDNQGDFMCG